MIFTTLIDKVISQVEQKRWQWIKRSFWWALSSSSYQCHYCQHLKSLELLSSSSNRWISLESCIFTNWLLIGVRRNCERICPALVAVRPYIVRNPPKTSISAKIIFVIIDQRLTTKSLQNCESHLHQSGVPCGWANALRLNYPGRPLKANNRNYR